MAKKNIDWNGIRKKLDEVLISYNSIIDLEDREEFMSLGNDIITIMRGIKK